MRYYADLLKLRCFTCVDVAALTGSMAAAESLLTDYRRRGYIDRVRNGLWVVLGLDDHQPVASRFRIATAVNSDACVSHHSAFEYHGYANQVSYEICVTSATKFRFFDYGGTEYRWFAPRIALGVDRQSDGTSVTDLERTVLDSINDMEKTGGLEEVLTSLEALPYLDSDKLTDYLALYNKQVLYQKTGYMLSLFNQTLRLPDSFYAMCKAHISKSVRYLDRDLPPQDRVYDRQWQLFVYRTPAIPLTQGVI